MAADTDTNTQFVKQTDFLTLLANACLYKTKGTQATAARSPSQYHHFLQKATEFLQQPVAKQGTQL